MLDQWSLANSRRKKRIASYLFENRNLRGAACLHALSQSEAESMRAYGLRNSIAVIPNGVELPVANHQALISHQSQSEKRILLFLGRLHPKKGLMNALKAWKHALHSTSSIQNSTSHEWQFVVAGWDQGGHEADLKRLCNELGLEYAETPASDFLTHNQEPITKNPSVVFVGPTFGEQKNQLLRRASAFILPSFSEGLPMSVLEAWSYYLPVLMTDYCNLPEGFSADAALRIGTDVTSIAEGMCHLLRSPISDLRSLGANGRGLVERQFTWQQVATQMKAVYDWVLGGRQKPDCVR